MAASMRRKPDALQARRAHRVEYVVIHPRLTDHIGHRIVEKYPGRIGYYQFFGPVVKSIALRAIGKRRGLIKQLVDLGVVVKGVVVATPLLAREQHLEEVLG